MTDHETIADQLHDTIFQMLRALQTHDLTPLPENYLVFKRPEGDDWIILLFFKDATQLNESTRDSTCFQIHDFMTYNLGRMEEFKALNLSIFFEEGSMPETDEELERTFQAAIGKLDALKAEAGRPRPEECIICGHGFDGHQLAGFPKEGEELPTRGWMSCKEEGCACFRTWDLKVPKTV